MRGRRQHHSSSGAAKAIGEVIPALKGKLNGGAFRVLTLTAQYHFTAIIGRTRRSNRSTTPSKKRPRASVENILQHSDEPLVSSISSVTALLYL
jgi:glyceraldehyde 3-phosphate dehydrogenase